MFTHKTPYVEPVQLEKARTFWQALATENDWAPKHACDDYQHEGTPRDDDEPCTACNGTGYVTDPFYVQVWVDGVGNVTDSVAVVGMTEDIIVKG